jgi:peroxiredoxin Q/BCP
MAQEAPTGRTPNIVANAKTKKPVKRAAKKAAKAAAKKPAKKPVAAKKAPKAVAKKPVAAKKAAKKPFEKVASNEPPPTRSKTEPALANTKSTGQQLGVGDRSPSFELPDQDAKIVSSKELAGRPYVLYFYPKDDTPGCTAEACGFRDDAGAFNDVGARVLGVSPDTTASHERFAKKYGLNFTLLSDTDKELAQKYGTWVLKKNYGKEYMGIERSTFVVDGRGVIRAAWRRVRVDGHVDKVRQAVEGLR